MSTSRAFVCPLRARGGGAAFWIVDRAMPGVEEEIKAWVADYIRASGEMYKGCTDDTYKEFASKFTSEDMTFIRPSGNPMNMTGFKEMWSSGMIENSSSNLVSVDTVRLTGLFSCWPAALPVPWGSSAVVTYTLHDKFTFNKAVNDDIVKFSAVLEKGIAGWKVCHVQRATGQAPPASKSTEQASPASKAPSGKKK